MKRPPPTRPYGAPFPDAPTRKPRDPRLEGKLVRASRRGDGTSPGLRFFHVDTGPPTAERASAGASGNPTAATEIEVVLCLHGLAANHRFYRENLLALGARFRVLAPDLPGFGRSDKPDASYAPDFYARELLAFLDEKGVERAHVVGHSLGGQSALHLAALAPDRVRSLVLVAPAGSLPFGEPLARLVDLLGRAALPSVGLARVPPVPRAALAVALLAALPGRPDLARALEPGYAAALASPEAPHLVRAAHRAMSASLAARTSEILDRVSAPTFITWGARDHILPDAGGRLLLARLARAQLSLYPRAGHCPMLEEPARWNEEVIAFLVNPAARFVS